MPEDFAKHFAPSSESPTEPAAESEFAKSFTPAGPTSSEQLETGAKAAAGGAVEGGLITAGIAGGAKAGLALTAAIPIPGARVAGTTIGGIAGGVAGYFAGSEARDALTERGYALSDISSIDEELRPAAYAGEVFGSAVSMTGATIGLAKAGLRAGGPMVGRWIDNILLTAKNKTSLFAAAETVSAVGAAAGAATAESISPGSDGWRIAGEIGGGMFSPVKTVSHGVNYVKNQFTNAAKAASTTGRDAAAGKVLRDIITEHGEDPELVAKLLKQEGVIDTALTSAQKTGSPAIAAIERELSKYNAGFGAGAKKAADEGMESIRSMIQSVASQGTPEALKQAGKMRQTYFRTLISSSIKKAEHTALTAAAKITSDTPASQAEISKVAGNAMSDVLKQARKAEGELWEAVPLKIPAKPSATKAKFDSLRSELLARENVPDVIEGTINDWSAAIKAGEPFSVGELIKFRKRALVLARQADSQGVASDARFYGELAESALDDIDSSFAAVGERGGAEIADQYTKARTFSRELHDTFTRTFAGKAVAKGKFGNRVPPELMLKRALATGKEKGSLQFKELEEATRFMLDRGSLDESSLSNMIDSQERLLRLTASNVVDAETGRVNTRRLSDLISKEGDILGRFPEVKKDLTAALTSEKARKRIEAMGKNASTAINNKAAFSKLANGDPIQVAKSAVNSLSPDTEITRLAKIAARGDAMDGLSSSLMEAATIKSTDAGGGVNLAKLKDNLFSSPATGRKSVIDSMVSNKVMSKEQSKQIGRLLEQAENIAKSRGPQQAADIQEDAAGVMSDLLVGGVGASAATAAAETVGSKRILMIQAAGAKAARRLFKGLSDKKIKEVLAQSLSDPELTSRLLSVAPTEKAVLEKIRFLHSYLLQIGIYEEE